MDLYKLPKRKMKKEEPPKIYTKRENMLAGGFIAVIGGAAVAWFSYDSYVLGKSTIYALVFMCVIALVLIVFGLYKMIYALTSKRYSKEASAEEKKQIEEQMKKRR